MKSLVDKKIQEMIKFSKDKWDIDVKVNISYSLNSSKTVGCYIYDTRTINLNLDLLNEYKELYISETVVHEFCHALVHNKFPNHRNGYRKVMPHGKEFKAFSSWFGLEGKATTSSYKDSKTIKPKRKRVTFKYSCGCKTHELSSIRHNRVLNKGVKYYCTQCNNSLKAV